MTTRACRKLLILGGTALKRGSGCRGRAGARSPGSATSAGSAGRLSTPARAPGTTTRRAGARSRRRRATARRVGVRRGRVVRRSRSPAMRPTGARAGSARSTGSSAGTGLGRPLYDFATRAAAATASGEKDINTNEGAESDVGVPPRPTRAGRRRPTARHAARRRDDRLMGAPPTSCAGTPATRS